MANKRMTFGANDCAKIVLIVQFAPQILLEAYLGPMDPCHVLQFFKAENSTAAAAIKNPIQPLLVAISSDIRDFKKPRRQRQRKRRLKT